MHVVHNLMLKIRKKEVNQCKVDNEIDMYAILQHMSAKSSKLRGKRTCDCQG